MDKICSGHEYIAVSYKLLDNFSINDLTKLLSELHL